MEYFVIVILLGVLAALLYVTFGFSKNTQKPKGKKDFLENIELTDRDLPDRDRVKQKPCPLCGSLLAKNETVKSKVYPSGQKDSIMDVFGCPYCIPPNGKKKRICPVCQKTVPDNGYVVGRYFVRPNKRHLHVLGCTLCRKV